MINGRGLYEPRLFYVGLGCGDGKLLFNFNDNGVDMNRDQLADWLHCLDGGMYDWVVDEIRKELAKPEQEPVAWAVLRPDGRVKLLSHQQGVEVDLKWTPLYTAPPRKPWQGLTSEDWENTPDTGKQGCERDCEIFDWIEQTLKDKNDTF